MSHRRGNNLDSNLIFQEYFNDEQSVRRNGGIPTDVVFDKGIVEFAVANNKITFPTVTFGNEFSIRVIATPNDVSGIEYLFSKITATKNGPVFLYFNDILRFYPNVSGGYLFSASLSAEKHEIIGTWDGSTAKLYINNIEETGDSGSQSTPDNFSEELLLGLKYDNTSDYEGKIELVEIYNKVLNSDEILNLYNDARYKVPQLEHSAQGDGTDLNVSDCVNAVAPNDYTSFSNATAIGFSAISDGSVVHNAGTADEIVYVSGQRFFVEFNLVLNSGTVPLYDISRALTGASQTIEGAQIASAGYNTFVFTIDDTSTGVLLFENISTATNFEISNLSVQTLAVEPTSKILHVTGREGVAIEKTDQNTITTTDLANFKDGSIRVMDFNGSSSLIESTLADNVNTIMFWAKPKTASESIIDLGGGNTITIASGVLTAAWADDLYVNGATGTAVQHNEWSLIVCRIDSALALTDIDIGKISTAFYDGMLSEVIFIDGVVTDAEISQAFSSSKNLYQK